MRTNHRGFGLRRETKTLAFTGAANLGQVNTSATIFTVTGEVLISAIVPFCTEDLATTTGTVSLGVTGNVTLFVAATGSGDINNGTFWVDGTPDTNGVALPAALKDIAITDDVIVNCLTANTTDGTIRFDVYWLPLSTNGNLVAA